MKETITTPDGMKLRAVYRGCYQTCNMVKENRCMCVTNPKNAGKNFAIQQQFDSAEEAKTELVKLIQKYNNGARVETTACGCIGIDLVVTEEDAKEMQIVHWEVQKRWVSSWEVQEKG